MSVFVCKGHFWWRQTWRHLNVTILQCWDKFCNVLVHWSIRMIRAKNYETVSKFVKGMTKILWPLFFPDTVYMQKWPIYGLGFCGISILPLKSFSVTVSNFVRIRSKMAALLPFNWFKNGGRRHLEFTSCDYFCHLVLFEHVCVTFHNCRLAY